MTASATSSGVPKRCMGWGSIRTSCTSLGSVSTMEVAIAPGATALMRMPMFAYSPAAVLVIPTTACLAAT